MGRTARTQRLTALAVRKYADDPSAKSPLHDGGGLYLRKRGAALHWTLRLTDPASGAEQWHRLFPEDPLGTYPHKSLADARAEARRLWSTRSSGGDPRAERRRQIRAREEADAQQRLAHAPRTTVRTLTLLARQPACSRMRVEGAATSAHVFSADKRQETHQRALACPGVINDR